MKKGNYRAVDLGERQASIHSKLHTSTSTFYSVGKIV